MIVLVRVVFRKTVGGSDYLSGCDLQSQVNIHPKSLSQMIRVYYSLTMPLHLTQAVEMSVTTTTTLYKDPDSDPDDHDKTND